MWKLGNDKSPFPVISSSFAGMFVHNPHLIQSVSVCGVLLKYMLHFGKTNTSSASALCVWIADCGWTTTATKIRCHFCKWWRWGRRVATRLPPEPEKGNNFYRRSTLNSLNSEREPRLLARAFMIEQLKPNHLLFNLQFSCPSFFGLAPLSTTHHCSYTQHPSHNHTFSFKSNALMVSCWKGK